MTSENRAVQARGQRPVRTPGKVKWIAAGLWLEAAFLVLGIVLLLLEAKSKVDHGQRGAGELMAAAALSLPFVALLATCAVLALRGTRWVWWLAGALQIFFALVGVITVIAGGIVMLPYIAVPAAILWLLHSASRGAHGQP